MKHLRGGLAPTWLHENLSQASQSPHCCTESAEAISQGRNSNQCSTLQKDSVQCIVGAIEVIRLLSSIWYINSQSLFTGVCLTIFVLLEDAGSETISQKLDEEVLVLPK